MGIRMARAAFVLVSTLLFYYGGAAAADVVPYFETSGSQKPRGDAGVSVAHDKLQFNADVALRSGDRTQVIPRVSSAFALSNRFGVETELNLAEWNGRDELIDRTFDTRLHFKSPAPFLEALEGRFWRSPDGRSGRILKFGFYQTVRDSTFALPLTVRGSATVETASGGIADAGLPGNRKVRLETEVAGLPAGARARKALRMKVERQEGSRPHDARSIAYDHAWTVGASSKLGLNVEMREATSAQTLGFEPSFGLSWRSELR